MRRVLRAGTSARDEPPPPPSREELARDAGALMWPDEACATMRRDVALPTARLASRLNSYRFASAAASAAAAAHAPSVSAAVGAVARRRRSLLARKKTTHPTAPQHAAAAAADADPTAAREESTAAAAVKTPREGGGGGGASGGRGSGCGGCGNGGAAPSPAAPPVDRLGAGGVSSGRRAVSRLVAGATRAATSDATGTCSAAKSPADGAAIDSEGDRRHAAPAKACAAASHQHKPLLGTQAVQPAPVSTTSCDAPPGEQATPPEEALPGMKRDVAFGEVAQSRSDAAQPSITVGPSPDQTQGGDGSVALAPAAAHANATAGGAGLGKEIHPICEYPPAAALYCAHCTASLSSTVVGSGRVASTGGEGDHDGTVGTIGVPSRVDRSSREVNDALPCPHSHASNPRSKATTWRPQDRSACASDPGARAKVATPAPLEGLSPAGEKSAEVVAASGVSSATYVEMEGAAMPTAASPGTSKDASCEADTVCSTPTMAASEAQEEGEAPGAEEAARMDFAADVAPLLPPPLRRLPSAAEVRALSAAPMLDTADGERGSPEPAAEETVRACCQPGIREGTQAFQLSFPAGASQRTEAQRRALRRRRQLVGRGGCHDARNEAGEGGAREPLVQERRGSASS